MTTPIRVKPVVERIIRELRTDKHKTLEACYKHAEVQPNTVITWIRKVRTTEFVEGKAHDTRRLNREDWDDITQLIEEVRQWRIRNKIKYGQGRGIARVIIIEYEIDKVLTAMKEDINEDKTLDECYAASILEPHTLTRWLRQVRRDKPLGKLETQIERDQKIRLYNAVKNRKIADQFLGIHWDELPSQTPIREVEHDLVELRRIALGERDDDIHGDRRVYGYAHDLEYRFALRLPVDNFDRYRE